MTNTITRRRAAATIEQIRGIVDGRLRYRARFLAPMRTPPAP